VDIAELKKKTVPELLGLADEFGVPDSLGESRQELVSRICRAQLAQGGQLRGDGTLEIVSEGYGFLRAPEWSFLAGPGDIYISPSQIKRFGLRTGDVIAGPIRPPKPWERFVGLLRLESVNGIDPEGAMLRGDFDTLRPRYPDERLRLESHSGGLPMRIVDLFAPIGKGQRGLIVAPPRAGKTILLQQMANAISENHPEVFLIVLLIDERPEEVTDFRRSVPGAEVISSTFDEPATRHVMVTEMVGEKARRLVEVGRDVVILLDSITRLARAYNANMPHSGKIMTGGLDSNALQRPKKFFGAARAIEKGGSLTIIGTALVDTGSKMDTVIFEEFKGTGNSELVLSRELSERRVFPAIDLNASSTRREELLLAPDALKISHAVRNLLARLSPVEAMNELIAMMKRSPSLDELARFVA